MKCDGQNQLKRLLFANGFVVYSWVQLFSAVFIGRSLDPPCKEVYHRFCVRAYVTLIHLSAHGQKGLQFNIIIAIGVSS